MKINLFFLLIVLFANTNLFSQNKTIILIRHAEKDISKTADKVNPNLTEAGMKRAQKFLEIVKKYRPDEIFSSNFIRTRDTVTPLAIDAYDKYRLQIQIYDHTKLDDFAKKILASKSKTIVVVGHNSTTPALANIFINQQKYSALDESEYDKLFIINMKKGKIVDQKIIY